MVVALNFPRSDPSQACHPVRAAASAHARSGPRAVRAYEGAAPEPRVTTSVGWPKRLGACDDFIMRGNWRSLLSTEADRLRTELPSASSSHDAQATVAHVAELLNQIDDWGSSQPISLWNLPRVWWTDEEASRACIQVRE